MGLIIERAGLFAQILRRAYRSRVFPPGDVIALHDYRALYFSIPKNANSSLKLVCSGLISCEEPSTSGPIGAKPFRGTDVMRALERRQVLLSRSRIRRHGDYFKFCFVRNPWCRLVSCYSSKVDLVQRPKVPGMVARHRNLRMGMSFDDFARHVCKTPDGRADKHFRSQHRFVTDRNGKLLVDDVGYFESLSEDFRRIFDRIGVAGARLSHRARSNHKPYREYYTDELREMVGERYAEDVRLFGYDFVGRAPSPA